MASTELAQQMEITFDPSTASVAAQPISSPKVRSLLAKVDGGSMSVDEAAAALADEYRGI